MKVSITDKTHERHRWKGFISSSSLHDVVISKFVNFKTGWRLVSAQCYKFMVSCVPLLKNVQMKIPGPRQGPELWFVELGFLCQLNQ